MKIRCAVFVLTRMLFTIIAPAALSAQLVSIPITPAGDRAFSEFNHHLAGAFLLGIGALAFLSAGFKRLRFLSLVWPFFFILPGIYLAFMSDPDVWPMGAQGLMTRFLRTLRRPSTRSTLPCLLPSAYWNSRGRGESPVDFSPRGLSP